jgi:ribosomal-protein-alanine N-acetyltransferase
MTHKGTVTLETERLILRRFELTDADAMFRNWASDPEVTKFARQGAYATIEESLAACNEIVNSYKRDDFYNWAIVHKGFDEPIGRINITQVNDIVELVHVSFMIGRHFWNKGYTTEALSAVVRFFFKEVGTNRIEGRNDPQNPPSEKVMIKCGFQYEGLLRKGGKNSLGLVDCKQYAILAEDYFKTAQLTFAPYDLVRDREFLTAAHGETFKLTFKLEQKPEWLAAELAKPRDVRDGAYIGGRLVGICDLQRRSLEGFGDYGRVSFFFIAPEYRNRGFGGQLIVRTAEWCRSQGLDRLTLNTGKDNYQAQKCYEKNGFVRFPQIDTEKEFGFVKIITTYTIRAMTLADYAECYALWQVTSGADLRTDCQQRIIENILCRNPGTCFVAIDSGVIVGTVTCEFGGDGAYLSHLAVSETHRRRGIASALVEHLQKKLVLLGVRKVRILVFSGNETAHKFWESIGFETRNDVVFRDKKI